MILRHTEVCPDVKIISDLHPHDRDTEISAQQQYRTLHSDRYCHEHIHRQFDKEKQKVLKKKKAIWAISSKSLQSIHALWPRNSMLGISHKKIKTAVERFKYKHVHSGTVYYSETEIRVL